MAKAWSIKGNADWSNWENQSYTINWRWVVPRAKLVREIESWMHPDFHTMEVDGTQYARSNSNSLKKDNIDN